MTIQIVHIEDDKPLANILRISLCIADPLVQLRQFEEGESALPYIEQNKDQVDLFILDIRLPGNLNGLQVAQKIRDLNCPGHILLTSAFSSPNQTLLSALRSEYVPKPWHILDLTQKLLKYRLDKVKQEPAEHLIRTEPK